MQKLFRSVQILSGLKMKPRMYIRQALRKFSEIKKEGFHFLLISSFFIPILLILFLDFFNMEAFGLFNGKFMFELTWKGRMFYFFFAWLLILELVLNWNSIVEKQHKFGGRFRVLLIFIFAAVPSVYILGVNFLGLDQMILNLGQVVNIRPQFINEPWPLVVEYIVFAMSFIFTTWLAYGHAGLKSFSISLSFLAGISFIYLVDTAWPYGTLKPMELLAVPTAAWAAALLDILGYNVSLAYNSSVTSSEFGTLPRMIVRGGGEVAVADVAWVCAGVQSLFLYTLVALIFFKKSTMQRERKIIFFLIGAAGTYLVNIFRIASFFIIFLRYGGGAAWVFHNSYGELYFLAWILLYFMVIVAIQSGKINRLLQTLRRKLEKVKSLFLGSI